MTPKFLNGAPTWYNFCPCYLTIFWNTQNPLKLTQWYLFLSFENERKGPVLWLNACDISEDTLFIDDSVKLIKDKYEY